MRPTSKVSRRDSDQDASQHNALDTLYVGIETQNVNWVLDGDIRGFLN